VLEYLYLDTGAMYRAVTAVALRNQQDPADEAAITDLARRIDLSFPGIAQAQAVNPQLLADGIDITATLRTPEVEHAVSAVSAYRGVREALVARQRAIARERSVVMVGRDIGTVVLPDAEIKIFLTASVEERALRRHQERLASGVQDNLASTLEDLRRRDRLDSERPVSPLRPADDAVLVDTTGLESEQSLATVLALVRTRVQESAE